MAITRRLQLLMILATLVGWFALGVAAVMLWRHHLGSAIWTGALGVFGLVAAQVAARWARRLKSDR